jgi:hypothetical protein
MLVQLVDRLGQGFGIDREGRPRFSPVLTR